MEVPDYFLQFPEHHLFAVNEDTQTLLENPTNLLSGSLHAWGCVPYSIHE